MKTVIDLRIPNLREVSVGTVVITSKGFEFVLHSRDENDIEHWLDRTAGIVWHDTEPEYYTHNEAVKEFGKYLPTIEEFEEAERHGFREVLPNMEKRWFWSASLVPGKEISAYGIHGTDGTRGDDYSARFRYSVRCVNRQMKIG